MMNGDVYLSPFLINGEFMSIFVTNQGLGYLRDNLSRRLEIFEITRAEIETEIIIPLIKSIQAQSRWVVITKEEVERLARRYFQPVPSEPNFKTAFGKIRVSCKNGIYYREYFAEDTVLKGWHREVVGGIKERGNIPFNKEIGEIIFNIGQVVISNENNLYLRIDHERHVA